MIAAALAGLLAQDLLRMDVDRLLAPQVEPTDKIFLLSPAWGYVGNRDAEEGAWSLNLVARARLTPQWSLEAGVSWYYHEYRGDDLRLTRVPVQISALYFPFRPDVLRPYLLAGAGVYPLWVSYKDSLDALDDDSDTLFGAHAGLGAEMQMGTSHGALFDFRYNVVGEPDLDSRTLEDVELDTWQITVGFAFLF